MVQGGDKEAISPYDCYQTCATYILYQGIEEGGYMYQCRLVKGEGSCWIGYFKKNRGWNFEVCQQKVEDESASALSLI